MRTSHVAIVSRSGHAKTGSYSTQASVEGGARAALGHGVENSPRALEVGDDSTGRATTGIMLTSTLKAMFGCAPDTRIKEHPIKISKSEWTAVMGIMEGTFTKPMPLPNGQMIPPTGKAFKLTMVTLGRWNDGGVMCEEYLFWDNQAFMKQLGIGPADAVRSSG